ncbi:unnamed protein product [Lathyrus sativus]|nr:unnamed protein product [Lathyrus sativus]
MALRATVLRHVRVPLQAAPKFQPWNASIRSMSSHDDHIKKEENVDRSMSSPEEDRINKEEVIDKVDPSKVTSDVDSQKDLAMDNLYLLRVLRAVQEAFKPMF